MLGEEVVPVARYCSKLGHGRVEVVDLAPSTVPTADARDPGEHELVRRAHTRSLERAFDAVSPACGYPSRSLLTPVCSG